MLLSHEKTQALDACELALREWSSAHVRMYGTPGMFEFELQCVIGCAKALLLQEEVKAQVKRQRKALGSNIRNINERKRIAA